MPCVAGITTEQKLGVFAVQCLYNVRVRARTCLSSALELRVRLSGTSRVGAPH